MYSWTNSVALLIFVLRSGAGATETCKKTSTGLTCEISRLSDCERIPDEYLGPYVLSSCFNTYKAVKSIVNIVAQRTGRTSDEIVGSVKYYVNDVNTPDQTSGPCMRQAAPWDPSKTISPGLATCDLDGYTMSLSRESVSIDDSDNPLGMTKLYPGFFDELLQTGRASLEEYNTTKMNMLTKSLGAYAATQFMADYTPWATAPLDDLPLYAPPELLDDPNYFGMSSGGGDGMGGEIVTDDGVTILAFGGGGGGGFTSNETASYIGSGGGGGVQHTRDAINGLGVGAGTSYREGPAQFTYSSYCGGPPTGDVDAIVEAYGQELDVTFEFLSGLSFLVRGGGGFGSGYEYLKENGEEYPQSMSTGAAFSYSYRLAKNSRAAVAPPDYPSSRMVQDFYQQIGVIFNKCARQAPGKCPGGYDNWVCTCQAQYNCTVAETEKIVTNPSEIPSWVLLNTCNGAPTLGPAPGPAPDPCSNGSVLG